LLLHEERQMFDLDDIRSFVEVAETGGFGRAGRTLGLSKSIVSRRVARLEAELGAQLLSRTTRGVVVTEAGLAFKVYADRVLSELEAAREAIACQGGEVAGTLKLAAPLSFGITHLGPVIAELATRHPRLNIEAHYSDRFVDLIGERFDVAVRLGNLADSSLIARRIAPIKAAMVAAPSYLERRGTPRRPEDLDDHDALTQLDSTWRFREGKREIVIHPKARMKADSGQAIVEAAVAGLGIAALPTFLAGPELAAGRLVPILLDFPLPEAGFWIVRPPPASHVSSKVRALTDLLIERFGGEPTWDACYGHERGAGAVPPQGPHPQGGGGGSPP
jgi:DNA-binding transcriptional LysR family regulator